MIPRVKNLQVYNKYNNIFIQVFIKKDTFGARYIEGLIGIPIIFDQRIVFSNAIICKQDFVIMIIKPGLEVIMFSDSFIFIKK